MIATHAQATLSFHPPAAGARVVIRDEEWLVRHVQTWSNCHAIHVTGLSELVRGRSAIFRSDLDSIVELRPEETKLVVDPSPAYRRSRLYLECLLRRSPPTDSRLYIGHRGAMNNTPYQLEPAAQALASPRARILMADGVGLGKTIEVGILLSELIQRGQGDRILVVALKSILTQFQKELWGRFSIPLVRLDSVGLERLRSKIPSNMNPFHYFNRVIISIDTLKRDDNYYRRFLEQCDWDVIVIDECQNVALKTTGRSQRARLANLLATRCSSLILTSATPHDGTAPSFASLMNLLEPTAVADPENYTREDIRGLFIRRFKKDVSKQTQGMLFDRDVQLDRTHASPEEDAAFEKIAALQFRTIDRKRHSDNKGILFRTTLLKAFLSSPKACLSTIEERLKQPAMRDHEDPDVAHDRRVLGELRATVEQVSTDELSKFAKLVSWLKRVGIHGAKPKERVVIFSERIHTLQFLKDELMKALGLPDSSIAVFQGTMDDQKQQELVRSFGSATTPIRVLLASDAASEGINLHYHCHRLVHFDVPWSLIRMEQRNGRIDRYGQTKIPELRYLLTIPSNPGLKGDLRILERLVEREAVANKNLGDVAWLMQQYDPEKEEERVAEAIQNHEPPETTVPDLPDETDFLSSLLDDQEETASKAGPEVVEPLSLYDADEAYFKAAFHELDGEIKDLTPPEWIDAHSFRFVPPEDLKRRLQYLPREMCPAAEGEFMLTTDRSRVQRALEKARDDGTWADWQLLWNLHPIAEWLGDCVLASFSRHEAPVLRVPKGIDGTRACFVVQGLLSNAMGQPVLVEWFGVEWGKGSIVPFPELVGRTKLDADLTNDRRPIDVTALTDLLTPTVDRAREHMKALRQKRADQLKNELKPEFRRAMRWRDASLARIEEERKAILAAGRSPRSDEQRKFEACIEDVNRHHKARQEWLDRRARTHESPFLRIAAVLVPKEMR